MTPLLTVDHLAVRYGDIRALDDVSLSVAPGELVAIVGRSGSGKSTLLRAVAGLQPASGGSVRLDGEAVRDVPPALAVVFQDYARSLFPWLTVRENVAMPLQHLGISAPDREERVTNALREVGLAAAGDRHPWQLSGGMQQRAAIARAIAYRARLLLMDEPFGSVDAQTRAELQDLLLDVWATHGSTVLLVTHDIDEAVYVADRVLVLSDPPTTVVDEIVVDLPRPRHQVDTRRLDRFVALRAALAQRILEPRANA